MVKWLLSHIGKYPFERHLADNIHYQLPNMLNFLDNLCGCFPPELKTTIIDYLSSADLNRTLIEEQKTNEGVDAPVESVYSHVKSKSYYFMKLQEDEHKQEQQSPQSPEDEASPTDLLEPNYYPSSATGVEGLWELYKHKLSVLRRILQGEIGNDYSKIYDSQDYAQLRIYCKQEIYQNKRFNSYRFSFRVAKGEAVGVRDYEQLQMEGDKFNLHEPLLASRERVSATQEGLEVFHRKYKKVLVISQHQLYTAEKCEVLQEEGAEAAYSTMFSVKGEWDKLADYSRGWLNLSGMRVSMRKEEEGETSLREEEEWMQFEGYINCELQISVNANMLKQPIAKEIRVYVQKLICSLTKSDAI